MYGVRVRSVNFGAWCTTPYIQAGKGLKLSSQTLSNSAYTADVATSIIFILSGPRRG